MYELIEYILSSIAYNCLLTIWKSSVLILKRDVIIKGNYSKVVR